jgi:hypothetical protein
MVDAFAHSPDSSVARKNALIVRDFMADRSGIYGGLVARYREAAGRSPNDGSIGGIESVLQR